MQGCRPYVAGRTVSLRTAQTRLLGPAMPKRSGRVAAKHPQSAVGAPAALEQSRTESQRNYGTFRFWHDERRFKGSADKCLVQQALFEAGGVRTGGYPKAAPISGPLGYQRPKDWDMLWSPARSSLKAVPYVKSGQLISAVPGMYSLTKKRQLSSTLHAAYGDAAWELVPQSYSLPAELPLFKQWLDNQTAAGLDSGPWMLKTAQHLGKGLVLLPGEAAYTAALQPRLPNAKPFVLAQKYISDPLLINGCKFGIRLWLLVTGVEPFTSYLHNQGLVLFSTDSYDLDSLSDDDGAASRAHITNYAQNVDGTVWDLTTLKQHLGVEVYRKLWAQLVRSAAHVACAALGDVRQEHAKYKLPSNSTFELMGLDYLVDAQMHPWLLEVNGTPSLAVEHADPVVKQLIHATKGAMVQDMVKILDCKRRFLARYGRQKQSAAVQQQQQPGPSAPQPSAQDAIAQFGKQRVDAELKHRGGFLPLMAHYPVLSHGIDTSSSRHASSSSSHSRSSQVADRGNVLWDSGTSSRLVGSKRDSDGNAKEAQEVTASVSGSAAAPADPACTNECSVSRTGNGVSFSQHDKRLFVFMQQWLRKQRRLAIVKARLQASRQQRQQQQQQGLLQQV